MDATWRIRRYLETRVNCEVSVDEGDRVSEEVEVVTVVPDLLLDVLLVATRRRVGANHLPVASLVDRVDDEL